MVHPTVIEPLMLGLGSLSSRTQQTILVATRTVLLPVLARREGPAHPARVTHLSR